MGFCCCKPSLSEQHELPRKHFRHSPLASICVHCTLREGNDLPKIADVLQYTHTQYTFPCHGNSHFHFLFRTFKSALHLVSTISDLFGFHSEVEHRSKKGLCYKTCCSYRPCAVNRTIGERTLLIQKRSNGLHKTLTYRYSKHTYRSALS